MPVTVRLFSVLRERARTAAVEIPADDAPTVADVITYLATHCGLGDILNTMPIAVAVNHEYADDGAVLTDGDIVGLIPPVSGGQGVVHAAITADVIDVAGMASLVRSPSAGAVVVFEGQPRDVAALTYEIYVEMATVRLREIATQVAGSYEICGIAVEHRAGTVPQGESSVAVVVAAPHRAAAFAAAQETMDLIKRDVPIWKTEVDGNPER